MTLVVSPSADYTARVIQTIKALFVQTLISKLHVKALEESILRRFSGRNIMPSKATFVLPFQDRTGWQFRAVIVNDRLGFTVETDDTIEISRESLTRQGGVSDERQTFSSEVVDYAQYTETPTAPERVIDKVGAPTFARAIRDRLWYPDSGGSLPATTAFDGESLFPIKQAETFLVNNDTSTGKHELYPTIVKAPLL